MYHELKTELAKLSALLPRPTPGGSADEPGALQRAAFERVVRAFFRESAQVADDIHRLTLMSFFGDHVRMAIEDQGFARVLEGIDTTNPDDAEELVRRLVQAITEACDARSQ